MFCSYVGPSAFEEPEEPDSRPNFDVAPQAAVTAQGAPVRFLVRISGKPTPEVTWLLNEEPIIPDSMTKIYGDGAINYLEIGRCMHEVGANKLRVVARNALGEASAETVLTVANSDQARPDLKHVAPGQPNSSSKSEILVEPSQHVDLLQALSSYRQMADKKSVAMFSGHEADGLEW
ncbi:unnamed protein product [Protopolystoma xenopodis]|uniref:Immunoglobulin I-set domain-containing protein n=1 Tax=Protopolystoma xenopodis TaxID=117903 RepID=A0A3S4ZXT3_9PLAT|nr:unnamed protein product [Protopolystoma xenopodis]